jgi:hypothetical protein
MLEGRVMDLVEKLIQDTNWYAVRKAMRVTGHRWSKQEEGKTVYYLPDEQQLREAARRLLRKALRQGGRHRAGGLEAIKEGNSVRLQFCTECSEGDLSAT